MNFFQRLRQSWPGAMRQRVTRTGIIYSFSIVLVSMVAMVSGNNLLYLVLAAMFSVLLVSGFVSKWGLSSLEVDLDVPPHISARRSVAATLRLRNLKRWMPTFSIHIEGTVDSGLEQPLYFPSVPAGMHIDEPVRLVFHRRGRYGERTFQLTTRFPFGFAERHQRVTLRQEIVVYPCLDPSPGMEQLAAGLAGELESQQRGASQDFHHIRPYQHLESARHVDWKATAHTGALQLREFARHEDQAVLLALDLRIAKDQRDWFETAVEEVAFLTYYLDEIGKRIRFFTQEVDWLIPAEADVYTILRYLALVEPRIDRRTERLKVDGEAGGTIPVRVVFSSHAEDREEWHKASDEGPGHLHWLGPAQQQPAVEISSEE